MDATKKRAAKLEAKGKTVDFKELLRMEPDGGTPRAACASASSSRPSSASVRQPWRDVAVRNYSPGYPIRPGAENLPSPHQRQPLRPGVARQVAPSVPSGR